MASRWHSRRAAGPSSGRGFSNAPPQWRGKQQQRAWLPGSTWVDLAGLLSNTLQVTELVGAQANPTIDPIAINSFRVDRVVGDFTVRAITAGGHDPTAGDIMFHDFGIAVVNQGQLPDPSNFNDAAYSWMWLSSSIDVVQNVVGAAGNKTAVGTNMLTGRTREGAEAGSVHVDIPVKRRLRQDQRLCLCYLWGQVFAVDAGYSMVLRPKLRVLVSRVA